MDELDEFEPIGEQMWSPSASRVTSLAQLLHLTAGSSCEMRGAGCSIARVLAIGRCRIITQPRVLFYLLNRQRIKKQAFRNDCRPWREAGRKTLAGCHPQPSKRRFPTFHSLFFPCLGIAPCAKDHVSGNERLTPACIWPDLALRSQSARLIESLPRLSACRPNMLPMPCDAA